LVSHTKMPWPETENTQQSIKSISREKKIYVII